jgi:murein DD-endopeptidase MepM/ murein hydrolase activator NlpD
LGRLRGFLACVSILGLLSAGQLAASADTAGNGQRRQQVEKELDLAKASNATLEAEVNRLNGEGAAEESRLAGARQAEVAARSETEKAARNLAEVEARSDAARRQLAQRAVQAYTQPSKAGGFFAMTQAATINDAMRRQTLVDVVQGRTVDAIEALRSAKEDEADAHTQLTRAQQLAADRTKVEAAQLDTVVGSQRSAQTARDAMQKRIATLTEEGRQLAAQDAAIQALIQSQASRPAPPPGSTAPAAPGPVIAPGPVAAPAPKVATKPSASGFIWPISGVVTSEYGPRWGGFHPGIDIAGPNGGAIVAARSGTVIYAQFNDGGYGNLVVIDNGGGFATAYAHQSKLAVSTGQSVSQGQVIGYEGSTGFSTGPHLHFEIRVDGTAQNPRNFLAGEP